MKSFHYDNYEEIGLFTFYRQQAEDEERLQAELSAKVEKAKQKREEAERKKNKTECLEEIHSKQEKQQREEESETLKSTISTPLVNFIKKVKLNTNKKRNENRLTNVNIKEEQNTKYIEWKETKDIEYQSCGKLERTAIPIKIPPKRPLECKREFFSKLNSSQNSEKEIIIPKEFSSFDVFEINNMNNSLLRKRHKEGLLFQKVQKNRLEAIPGNKRLPRLHHDESTLIKNDLISKKREKMGHLYDPKDILKNNKKYQINLPKPLYRNKTNNSESCIMSEIREKENTHLEFIQHYETIDNSFNY